MKKRGKYYLQSGSNPQHNKAQENRLKIAQFSAKMSSSRMYYGYST